MKNGAYDLPSDLRYARALAAKCRKGATLTDGEMTKLYTAFPVLLDLLDDAADTIRRRDATIIDLIPVA